MNLVLQMLVAGGLALVVTVIHGTGVVAIDRLFRREDRELRGLPLISREFGLMVPMAMCLFLLHGIEILAFALFYMGIGAIPTLEAALFFSTNAYTTLGGNDGHLAGWRLVGAFEGLVGFLLIGWSAAIFVTEMNRVLRRKGERPWP